MEVTEDINNGSKIYVQKRKERKRVREISGKEVSEPQ
jgi:hypothetical protein